MRTTLSSKGQIVLPAELREQDQIRPGQQFEIERLQEGEYLLRKSPPRSGGVLEWLQACPEKGWFERIPSENTDSL
jgi:AbrB family looped-hinge helix DNA binding protein